MGASLPRLAPGFWARLHVRLRDCERAEGLLTFQAEMLQTAFPKYIRLARSILKMRYSGSSTSHRFRLLLSQPEDSRG